jgi:hypothetical protein
MGHQPILPRDRSSQGDFNDYKSVDCAYYEWNKRYWPGGGLPTGQTWYPCDSRRPQCRTWREDNQENACRWRRGGFYIVRPPKRLKRSGKKAIEVLGGHVDILINSAGGFLIGRDNEIMEELFDSVYSLNVKVPYFLVAELTAVSEETPHFTRNTCNDREPQYRHNNPISLHPICSLGGTSDYTSR